MKKNQFLLTRIIVLLLLLFASEKISAQKAHGKSGGGTTAGSSTNGASGGAGSGSPTSVSAANGGTSVSGYSYHLPYRYHIKYKTTTHTPAKKISIAIKDEKCYTLSEISILKVTGWQWDIIPNPLLKSVTTFSYKINYKPIKGIANSSVSKNKIYFGTYINNYNTDTCILINNNCCGTHKDSVVTSIEQTTIIDTLDRYYNKTVKWTGRLFGRKQLKVAVTQSDSGKLALQFKNIDFDLNNEPNANNIDFKRFLPSGYVKPAIPIAVNDSAGNFFLQIENRNYVGNPTSYISLPYSALQYGAVTIPYKYRFKNKRLTGGFTKPDKSDIAPDSLGTSESTQSFNVAAFVGKKWGRTQFFYDPTQTHNTVGFMLAAFGGPSLITLTANNVNRYTDMGKYPTSQIAFSTGAAAELEWRTVNFGFFYGWDIPLEKSPWVYRYRGWIGFGIGFSLGMFTNSNSAQQIGGD